jgi:PAS domain S-box-containing protein
MPSHNPAPPEQPPHRPGQTIASLLDPISDAVFAFDPALTLTYVNLRAAALLGGAPADLIGRSTADEYPVAPGPAFGAACRQARASGQPQSLEAYFAAQDRWLEHRIYPTADGLTVFALDITERRRSAQTLLETQERLGLAVRSGNVGLWDWDLGSNTVYYSPEWKSQLGYAEHEINPDLAEWARLVHPDDLERTTARVQRYLASPYPNFQYEFRMRHKDGSYRWVLAQAAVLNDDQGRPVRMLGAHIDITERRAAEALIQRERDFSNALLDSLPGVFYLYDESLRFLRWNKNFERVTGYSAEEIAAISPLDLFTPDERELVAERIGQVFKVGASDVEALFRASDGALTPYYFTGRRTRQDGRDCLIGVGIDISERRRVELALRESEERYRQFVNTSPYAIGVHQDGLIEFVNPAAVSLFGAASPEQLIGTPVHDRVDPGMWPEVRGRMQRMLGGESGLYPTEERFRRLDGSTIPVEVFAAPFSYRGRPAVHVIARDISDRKQADEVLAASERRLSLIFATVSDVIFLLAVEPGETYRFVSVNPAFLAVTGLSQEQVVGKLMEEVLPPSAHAFVRANYGLAIRESRTVRWEEISAYPTGTLYGEVAVTPALDPSGACTHLIGSVHDITAIRQAQEEIQQLNLGLERRVAERTAQLLSANKELESFSYSVSHDLRAPLRAISGFAEIIARRHRAALNDEGQRYFDNIVLASKRMSHLIDDLLTYSRIGRSALRFEVVDLGQLLAALSKDLTARLGEIGGSLEIPDDLPSILGDKTLLTQIFTNLLDNALTYRKADTPLEIRLTWRADGDMITIGVCDNGIGIAAEYQEKIFNMFQRLHSEDAYPGTGIGLATVRKSAELLGGSVWVESDGHSGSQFYVRLPKERS